MDGHEAAALRREEWFRTARRKLDERFVAEGSPPATDDDWRLVLAGHADDYGFLPCDEDDLAEIAYGLIVFYRQRAEVDGRDPLSAPPITGATTSIDPPAWWVEESRERLDWALLPRVILRAALGLWGPPYAAGVFVSPLVLRDARWWEAVALTEIQERRQGLDFSAPLRNLDDMKPFLLRLAEKQPHEGPRRRLRYLTTKPDGSVENQVLMMRGDRQFFVGELDVYAGPQPPATFETRARPPALDEALLALGVPAESLPNIPDFSAVTFESVPTLEYLRAMSEHLALYLGVDSGEVTAWFLCDHEVVSPWIDIHVAPRPGKAAGTAAGLRMVLDVGSLSVTPDALARAYSDFRTGMLTSYGEDSLPKPPDDWDVRRRQFMAEWESQHKRAEWEGAWAEWQIRYPDSKWHKFRSFRNAHYAGKGAKP